MLHLLTDPKHSVNSVCFSADGDLLVSGSDDKTLKIWSKGSSGNFECKSTLTVDSGEYGVLSVSFSPKDNVIAAGCYNGKIHLVDAVAGEVKSTLAGHTGYVPAFPCSACSQSRGVCSLSSDEQAGLLRRV